MSTHHSSSVLRPAASAILALIATATVMACSTSSASEESATGGEQAVTGVSDLAEVEAALGLVPDRADASGHGTRPEAKLTAGPCYQKWGAAAGIYRYQNGAAFFRTAWSTPGSSGSTSEVRKAVLCVDVDVEFDGEAVTVSVPDIELDAALRYHLGAPKGGDAAMGTTYSSFAFGDVKYHPLACPADGLDPLAPEAMTTRCFGGIDFPGNREASRSLQLLVYRYAWMKALATNRFTMRSDAVGRFVSMEGDAEDQHLRFEKLDGHAKTFEDGRITKIAITPKGSDGDVEGRALVSCTVTYDPETELNKVDCKGI